MTKGLPFGIVNGNGYTLRGCNIVKTVFTFLPSKKGVYSKRKQFFPQEQILPFKSSLFRTGLVYAIKKV